MKPIIGITSTVTKNGYSVRKDYVDAVISAGGEPVLLPCTPEPLTFIDIVDGILFSGGGDILPKFFNAKPCAELDDVSEIRDIFELELCNAAVAADLPVLCICRGIQVLNCALGGTLIQHIDNHRNPPEEQPKGSSTDSRRIHDIEIMHGSLLSQIIVSKPEICVQVNSHHHQALLELGRDIVISARAADGTIEAVEIPGREFVIGVQWHPEDLINIYPEQLEIFKAFITAARNHSLMDK